MLGRKPLTPAWESSLERLLVDCRHPFRRVSIPEHLICQFIERSSILLCEATVKCPQVGLEIGELGRAWNGYNMISLVQHPGQSNLRCHASLLGSNLLDR